VPGSLTVTALCLFRVIYQLQRARAALPSSECVCTDAARLGCADGAGVPRAARHSPPRPSIDLGTT
jgi:hypothetical protein